MQIRFIYQGNGTSLKRVRDIRMGDGHAPGQVADHRERAFLAVGELTDDKFLSVLVHNHS